MKRLTNCLVFCLCLFSMPVMGSAAEQEGGLPEKTVETLSRSVYNHIGKAKLSDGTLIGEERAAKLEYPLLPYALREHIITRGTISGMARVCGLDWKNRNFVPMMRTLRQGDGFSDYQLAYAGMLHGASMSGGEAAMERKSPCSDALKVKIGKLLRVRK